MDESRGPGQPDKYKPEYCEMIIEHMSDGKSLVSFAASLRLAKQTVYNWTEKYPEFMDAFNIARTLCQEWWENQGRDGLFAEHQGRKINAGLHKFYMERRFPDWRETQIVETEDEDKLVIVRPATKEEE